jgi:alkylation response protein AidB-like acyl-CoA dehydrogenase
MTNTSPATNGLPSDELLASLKQEFSLTAAHHDETAKFPHANFKRLGDLGLFALTAPREYGGHGAGLTDATRVIRAVGGGESTTGLLLAMNYLMHHLLGRGRPPIYEELARAAVDGRGLLNALVAEPDLGSIMRGGALGTVAVQLANGDWQLNGRKAWATGSPAVNGWLVHAGTETADGPQIGSWLVSPDNPGLKVIPTWNHHGLRATASHEIHLEAVIVSSRATLGLLPLNSQLLKERNAVLQQWNGLLIAALYDGIARSGHEWLLTFLKERTPSSLGAPLATVPRLQGVVGEIESLLLVNDTLLRTATREADEQPLPNVANAQLVKHLVTTNAIKILDLALSITGNHGLDRRNPLERHYRDALCGRVHAPQSDTVLINAGKQSLGL